MTDVGDTVELPNFGDGTVIERIKKEDLKPLWEDHTHKYVLDPTEDEPTFYGEVCAVDGCGVGRLVRKV